MADDVVRAKRFELVDDEDNVYASLERDGTGSPFFVIRDPRTETPRVVIGLNARGTGSVDLWDGEGRSRLKAAVEEDGGALIRFRDENDREMLQVHHVPAGHPQAPQGSSGVIFSDGRNARVQLGISPDGSPNLTLKDRDGKEVASLSVGGNGEAILTLTSPDSPSAGTMISGPAANLLAVLSMVDEQGRPRVMANLGADGKPTLTLMDEDGNVVWETAEGGS